MKYRHGYTRDRKVLWMARCHGNNHAGRQKKDLVKAARNNAWEWLKLHCRLLDPYRTDFHGSLDADWHCSSTFVNQLQFV